MNYYKIKIKFSKVRHGPFKHKETSKIISGPTPEMYSDSDIIVILDNHIVVKSYYFRDSFGHWFSTTHDPWGRIYTPRVTHWMVPENYE